MKMKNYEEKVKEAEEITNKLKNRLNKLSPYESVSVKLYSRTNDFFLRELKNKDIKEYEKLIDKAIEITNNDVIKLNRLSPYEHVDIAKFMEIFFKHLRNLTPEKNISSKDKSNETNVILESKKEDKYAIFLSHSVKDKRLAGLFKKLFNDLNIDCFVAHDDIDEGLEWKPIIINTLNNSTLMFVLCTKNIENSAWVNFEVGLGYNKTVPIFIEDLSDKVGYIKDLQGIRMNPPNISSFLLNIVDMVFRKLGLKKTLTEQDIKSMPSFRELEKDIIEKTKQLPKNN